MTTLEKIWAQLCPEDIELEDSVVLISDEVAQHIFKEAAPPRYKTQADFLEIGNAAYSLAAQVESDYGLDEAIPHYERAAAQYIGSMSYQPLEAGVSDQDHPEVPPHDQSVLKKYCHCLQKIIQAEQVSPYADGASERVDRRQYLTSVLDLIQVELIEPEQMELALAA